MDAVAFGGARSGVTRCALALALVAVSGCGERADEAPPVAAPAPSTCGTELRAELVARADVTGAFTPDVALPVASAAASHPYEDGGWRRVTRFDGAWQVDGEPVEDLAVAFSGERDRLMLVVPGDLPAEVVGEAVAPLVALHHVRLNVVEPRYAGGVYLSRDAIHAERRAMGEACPALIALSNADSSSITSGMADPTFAAIDRCCDRIDAERVRALHLANRRPHRWVPLPSGNPEGKTVQEWIDGPAGPSARQRECSALAGSGPDDCAAAPDAPSAADDPMRVLGDILETPPGPGETVERRIGDRVVRVRDERSGR